MLVRALLASAQSSDAGGSSKFNDASESSPIQIRVTGQDTNGGQREALQALAPFYRALNTQDLERTENDRERYCVRPDRIDWPAERRAPLS